MREQTTRRWTSAAGAEVGKSHEKKIVSATREGSLTGGCVLRIELPEDVSPVCPVLTMTCASSWSHSLSRGRLSPSAATAARL